MRGATVVGIFPWKSGNRCAARSNDSGCIVVHWDATLYFAAPGDDVGLSLEEWSLARAFE
jgi:hypothetical protein